MAGHDGDLDAFVRRSLVDAYSMAHALDLSSRGAGRDVAYPSSRLAGQLKLVARMIKVEFGARVYYVEHGDGGRNYDTHAGQLPHHERMLEELSGRSERFTPTWMHRAWRTERLSWFSASSAGGLPRMSATGQITAPQRRCSYSAAAFAGVRPVRLPA